MKHYFLISICTTLLFFVACKQDSKPTAAAQPLPTLANTPEDVVRQWQSWIDKSNYKDAALLSTPRAQNWIVQINQIFGTATDTTNFKSIKCIVKDTTAMCSCQILDTQKEVFIDSFLLVKRNNQWLVDISEEQSEPQDTEVLENLLGKELEKTDDKPSAKADKKH